MLLLQLALKNVITVFTVMELMFVGKLYYSSLTNNKSVFPIIRFITEQESERIVYSFVKFTDASSVTICLSQNVCFLLIGLILLVYSEWLHSIDWASHSTELVVQFVSLGGCNIYS